MIDVLLVASWYPGVDDPTKGRFIADQAGALRATGRVVPRVASFEQVQLTGSALFRARQAVQVQRASGNAIRGHAGLFAPGGWAAPAGVPVARLPVASGGPLVGGQGHASDQRVPALRALVERWPSERRRIIHAHTGYPDGCAAAGILPAGCPLVITEHATFVARQLAEPAQRLRYLAGVRAASRFVAVSRTLADELRAAIPELEGKLVVIPNAVAVDDFSARPLSERQPDELLYVGYRTEQKGLPTLLAAVARVRATRPGVRLRLIGGSPTEELEATWRRMSEELGLGDAVSFEGPATRSEVAEAMARASLLVHASRRETFGVAPVEALASGLPVVATDTGPLREILGDDPTALGELVPPDDPEALSAAIVRALDRRTSFDPEALRRAVESRYGARTVAARIVELYEEVLDETAVPPARPRPATPSPGRGVESTASGPPASPLIVAFNTGRAGELLAPLPSDLLATLRVICAAGPGLARLPVGVERVIPVELGALGRLREPRGTLPRRLGRFLRDPRGALLRRRALGRREEIEAGLRAAGLAATVREQAAASGGPVELLCLEGIDYLAAAPLLHAGVATIAPGGVRWLADRWWSARPPLTRAGP